jgi:hypothetical protein
MPDAEAKDQNPGRRPGNGKRSLVSFSTCVHGFS